MLAMEGRGDFRIEKELFRSSTGAVYRARLRSNNKVVALKERRKSELGSEKSILNEVRILQGLRHPHLIHCFAHFWEGQSLYVVLEYAKHGDLRQHVEKHKEVGQSFSPKQVLSITSQLSDALAYLHAAKVVHRDVKSLNVLVTDLDRGQYTVKLSDMGVSRRLSEDTTLLQSFYGTPLYASPEICENKPYDEKTDMWSLGVVTYELTCLAHPFCGSSLVALGKAISQAKYEPLPRTCDPFIRELIGAMLQADPTSRLSARQVLDKINHMDEHGETPHFEVGAEEGKPLGIQPRQQTDASDAKSRTCPGRFDNNRSPQIENHARLKAEYRRLRIQYKNLVQACELWDESDHRGKAKRRKQREDLKREIKDIEEKLGCDGNSKMKMSPEKKIHVNRENEQGIDKDSDAKCEHTQKQAFVQDKLRMHMDERNRRLEQRRKRRDSLVSRK